MTGTRKLMVFGLIALAALLLGAVALRLLLDTSVHKARLEATASQALGLEVEVVGRLALDFFPALTVTLEDVHVRSQRADVVVAKGARIAIDPLSLLGQRLRIRSVELTQATIVIARDRDGRFNFNNARADGDALPALDWPVVAISGATISYADSRFASRFEGRDCRVDVHRLRHSGGLRSTLVKDLSFTAELGCAQVRKDEFTAADLMFSVDAKGGIVDLKPFALSIFGTPGTGQVRADFSNPVPTYRIVYSLPQFPIEEFFKTQSLKPMAAGRMDFSADLSTHGKSLQELRQATNGKVSLRAKGLTFKGVNLDREFARFESSQTFDLVDFGAVFFAGPLGLLVTKGYDFASLSRGAPGQSEIRTLVSDWEVGRGTARAQDVAMSTKHNRIVLRGGLDLVNDRFDDLTVALVDAQGCAKVRQQMRGSFHAPTVEKPSLFVALTGPAVRLLKKGGDALRGESCDVFYAGLVAAP